MLKIKYLFVFAIISFALSFSSPLIHAQNINDINVGNEHEASVTKESTTKSNQGQSGVKEEVSETNTGGEVETVVPQNQNIFQKIASVVVNVVETIFPFLKTENEEEVPSTILIITETIAGSVLPPYNIYKLSKAISKPKKSTSKVQPMVALKVSIAPSPLSKPNNKSTKALPFDGELSTYKISQDFGGTYSHKSPIYEDSSKPKAERIITGYKYDISAVDWLMPIGTSMLAVADGEIEYIQNEDSCRNNTAQGYGCHVILYDNLTGEAYLYGHLDSKTKELFEHDVEKENAYEKVKKQRKEYFKSKHINQGGLLGISDHSGNSSDPHLHFEIRKGKNSNFYLKSYLNKEEFNKSLDRNQEKTN